MNRKPLVIALVTLFLVAFGIRLYFALHTKALPDYSDMAWYNKVALQHGFPRELPPAYPLILRAIYALFGASNYRAVFVVQGFFGALTAALICWVTSKVGNLKAGITAGAISAIYPNFIVYGLTALTETFGVFFIVLLLAALVAAIGERKRSILAVILLLCGAAFRPVILFFAPGVFLSLKKKLTFAIACAVIVAPLVAYEFAVGLTFQRAAIALYETYYPRLNGTGFLDPKDTELGSDSLSSEVYVKAALGNIRRDRWRLVGNIYNKAAVIFSRGWDRHVMYPIVSGAGNTSPLLRVTHEPSRESVRDSSGVSADAAYVMEYAYIPIMLFGFVGMARLYNRKNRMLTLPVLSYLVLMIVFCIFKFRYRLLLEPIMIIYASLLVWRVYALPERSVPEEPAGTPPVSPPTSRDWIFVSAIFCVALAPRLYMAFKYPPLSNAWEGTQWKQLAQHLRFSADSAPLYPFFLRVVYSIVGAGRDSVVCAIQAVLGASIVFLMYAAAARLGGRRAGFIAAGISAAYPGFIGYGLGIRVDWLGVLMVALLMAVATGRLANRSRAMLSAAVVGLAMLVQPVLTWLAPGAFLAAKKRWAFLAVLILVVAPFIVGNAVRHHRVAPVYTPWALRVNLGNFNIKSGWGTIDRIYDSASAVVARGPMLGDLAESGGSALEKVRLPRHLYLIIMLLGFIGLARCYRRDQREVALPVLLYIVVLVLFSTFEIRLRAPLEPLLILYASVLLSDARERPVTAYGEVADPPLI